MTWKTRVTIAGIAAVLLFSNITSFEGIGDYSSSVEAAVKEQGSKNNFNGKNYSSLPKNTKIPVEFKKKVDGDTVRVLINNKEVKIRLLLIDTPESVKKGSPVQPYALEASKFTEKRLKEAKKLEVQFDRGDRTDRYNRALCYIYADGVMLQESLVEAGLARVAYAYEPNTTYLKQLKKVEKNAKEKKLKIWSMPGYVTKKGFNY